MSSSPTTTFLFTDIAGSTRLWAEHRDAMGAALARHDALLRAAVEEHGGNVFKTVGDAVCAAFPAPLSALAAALAGQRALAAEDWSTFAPDLPPLTVRMAVHSGVAEPRDGDWFGQPLNRVARLLAIGHGGQVLVSRATEELVVDQLPGEVTLRDLGEHRLKDLARPERVFQVVAVGLVPDFPPLRSLDALPGNLPVQLTSFVGRADELAATRALLAQHRLVTLTGVGGTGKTRLALQLAADVADSYPDGAWFVDLAPVAGEDGVPAAVTHALGARDDPARPAEAVLAEHLRARRLVVVLDNCEHVVAACARLVAGLLQACPDLTVLATSREPLAIDGETLSPVPPLATPALTDRPVSAAELARFAQHEAVRLFVDRAGAVVPGFAVTPANAPAIAQVCHRLDGVPLAIELAAARVKALGVEQIAARLDDRLRLLAGGGRDRLPRQQTLRAAIDWSYDLLPDVERRVLERLSVCTGAVPLALIEAVCASDGVEDWALLDALIALVDKSLVVPVERGEERWYRLLDTIRVYAAEKLAVSGDELATRRRHLGWYRALAEEAGIVRLGAECEPWQARIGPLAEDTLSAVRAGSAAAELLEAAVVVYEGLWWLWYDSSRGACAVGSALASRVNADALARDHPTLAWQLAVFLGWRGDVDEALRLADLAQQGFHQRGDARREAWACQAAAIASERMGDLDRFEALSLRALALKRSVDDPVDLSIAVANLGEVERARGRYTKALERYDEALVLLPASEWASYFSAAIRANQGHVLLHLGRVAEAEIALTAALAGLGEPWIRPCALSGLAGLAAGRGQVARAATLLGAAESLAEAAAAGGYTLEGVDQADFDRHAAAAHALSSAGGWAAAYAAGRAMSEDEAVAFALAGHGELDEPATPGEGETR